MSVINPKQLPSRYYHGMETDRRREEGLLKKPKALAYDNEYTKLWLK
ncbi:MAG TPA: hypothetical protein VN040_11395 [Pseudosphingobacterium sp.]|nr:hypothetical protein [Pseudosphingobacterium sp.]